MTEKAMFNGDNLRLARLMSGWSLNELGERVGATRQYIQQLETDKKKPAANLVDALAYELNTETQFFFFHLGNQVKEEECHFRKLRTTLISARRECAARATLLNKLVDSMEQRLDLPEVNFLHHEAVSLFDVEHAAIELRKYWGLGDGPIKSMIRVLENAGVIITTFGSVSEKVDALSVYRNRPIIVLNREKSSPRIRMDLGHECAHIVLHHGIETGDTELEAQADYFSSVFLLPRQALLDSYGAHRQSRVDWNAIRDIKITWGISARAIIYRLHQLEVLTPSQYRTANVHLSKTGQTKSEWYDDQVPYESPELLGASLALLGRSYGAGFGGLLKELHIKPAFLAELSQMREVVECYAEEDYQSENVASLANYRRMNGK